MHAKLHTIQIKFLCVHSWHAHVHLQTIMHTSSMYMWALNNRFDIINLVGTYMLADMYNPKQVVSSPWHTCNCSFVHRTIFLQISWILETLWAYISFTIPLVATVQGSKNKLTILGKQNRWTFSSSLAM